MGFDPGFLEALKKTVKSKIAPLRAIFDLEMRL